MSLLGWVAGAYVWKKLNEASALQDEVDELRDELRDEIDELRARGDRIKAENDRIRAEAMKNSFGSSSWGSSSYKRWP